jgi:hypothetical protein|nr:MAG TPA: hypothetical protein [Caudoviricetes sp.]
MKITLDKILACLLVLLAILLFTAYKTIKRQHKELERQENNITVLNLKAVAFRTTAGEYAEETRQLKLEKGELELYNADLYNKVREAGIKIRELKNATRTEVVTKIDTVIKTVHVGDTRTAKYNDGWNNIEVSAGPDTTKIDFNSIDTLDVIGSVKQKKFLFFKIGKPIQKITVSNKNPKSTIHVNFSAEFSK